MFQPLTWPTSSLSLEIQQSARVASCHVWWMRSSKSSIRSPLVSSSALSASSWMRRWSSYKSGILQARSLSDPSLVSSTRDQTWSSFALIWLGRIPSTTWEHGWVIFALTQKRTCSYIWLEARPTLKNKERWVRNKRRLLSTSMALKSTSKLALSPATTLNKSLPWVAKTCTFANAYPTPHLPRRSRHKTTNLQREVKASRQPRARLT